MFRHVCLICFLQLSGRFFNGLIAVGFELETVEPGHGGFACVAGSHKANVELPREWKDGASQVLIRHLKCKIHHF